MTYYDLLEKTAKKKREVLRKFNKALKGSSGFLVQAEIERNPGQVAYTWLAKDFCEEVCKHIEEWTEQLNAAGDVATAFEIADIYMAYQDGHDLSDVLPVEAKLWEE
jgi:hypothetical protein